MFECKKVDSGYGWVEYRVIGVEGMSPDEILHACDPNNFGGRVSGSYVKVYID